jgi:hypothetical protein
MKRATANRGPFHPPQKSVTASDEIVTTWMYSARKNSANFTPAYSV